MSVHDPLCPYTQPVWSKSDCTLCNLIVLARADERQQIAARVGLSVAHWSNCPDEEGEPCNCPVGGTIAAAQGVGG